MQILTLTGNIGRDPELRTTQGGDQICSFSVASKQGFKRDAKTEWFRCSVWGKRGETIAANLRKGMKVTVVGEFTIGEYQDKPQYDIRVSDVDWVPSARESDEPAKGGGGQQYREQDLDDNVPFASCEEPLARRVL